jgi:hypothetical protein
MPSDNYNPEREEQDDYKRERDFVDEFISAHPHKIAAGTPHPAVIYVTGEQLREFVMEDPEWIAKHATKHHPVVVTTPADLSYTSVTHLSPFISFRGIEWEDKFRVNLGHYQCCSLEGCKELRVFQGKFHGLVKATFAGFETIDTPNLKIFEVSPNQPATDLACCPNLKVARGRFPKGVNFHDSRIKEIDTDPETGLIIEDYDNDKVAAYFDHCEDLKVLVGFYPGKVIADNSGVETLAYNEKRPHDPTQNLIITKWDDDGEGLSLERCKKLKVVNLMINSSVFLEESGVERIETLKLDPIYNPDHPKIKLKHCKNLYRIPKEFVESPQIEMDEKTRERVKNTALLEEEARQKLRANKEGILEI